MTNESSAMAFMGQAIENLLIKNFGSIPENHEDAKKFIAENSKMVFDEAMKIQWELLAKAQNSSELKKALANKVYDAINN